MTEKLQTLNVSKNFGEPIGNFWRYKKIFAKNLCLISETSPLLTLEDVFSSSVAMNAITNSYRALRFLDKYPIIIKIMVDFSTAMNVIANSSIAMNIFARNSVNMKIIRNSPIAMNAVANSSMARDIIRNTETAWNEISTCKMSVGKYVAAELGYDPSDYGNIDDITHSAEIMNNVSSDPDKMEKLICSPIVLDSLITSADALYYICVHNNIGGGLERLSSTNGITTVDWENDDKWQILYNTLNNATDLFTKEYHSDTCDYCTIDHKGDLITLIRGARATNFSDANVLIQPRYSGCYSHGYSHNWSTGKHIMWGGHLNQIQNSVSCYISYYMFTPII